MTKIRNLFHFLNFRRLLYGFLLIALIIALIASFSPDILSKVANLLPIRAAKQASPTSSTASRPSSFIPHRPPVFNDPLNDKNDPFKWDTGSAGGATCFFIQGENYHIAAPARSLGGGCSPEAPNTNFTNFVYQIQMVINQGSSKQLQAGIIFCGSPEVLGGSYYGISFNTQGDWHFGVLTGGATGPAVYTLILNGNSRSIRTRTGQINSITVRVTHYHIDAQVNGQSLFSTIDKQLSGGQIGVSLNPGLENADVAFNDAMVWQI